MFRGNKDSLKQKRELWAGKYDTEEIVVPWKVDEEIFKKE